MSTTASTDTLWVVLDASDQIVLLCAGADAGDEVDEWRARGYRVVPVSGAPAS